MKSREILAQGMTLQQAGRLGEAERKYRDVLRRHPKNTDALQLLGQIALQVGEFGPAISLFEQALAGNRDNPAAQVNLGRALAGLGRHGDALATFEEAARAFPDFPLAHFNLGNARLEIGALDQAAAALRRTLELTPGHGAAHRLLSTVVRYQPGPGRTHQHVSQMKSLVADPGLADRDRAHIHFALGKAYGDLGEAADSFAHYKTGNKLRRAGQAYDGAAASRHFQMIKQVFSDGSGWAQVDPASPARPTSPTRLPRPVLILGMPRSGTTLVEQILASHPAIHGSDELPFLRACIDARAAAQAGKPFPQCFEALSGDQCRDLGRDYLGRLRDRAPSAAMVTDKALGNFLYVGAVARCLPGARIIHLRRDPMDTCFSIFKNVFGVEAAWANDLASLGHYYRLYDDLMAHWRATLPGFILDVDYENIVAGQETETRRMLDFLDLEWDGACLDFHNTKRPVRTLSAAQVRQPLYGTSIGAWRKFETELEPLRRALGGAPRISEDVEREF